MEAIIAFGVSGMLTVIFCLLTITLIILTIVFGIIRAIKGDFKKTFIVLLIVTIIFVVIDFLVINNLIKNFNEIKNEEAIWQEENEVNIKQENGKIILSDNSIKQLFMSDEEKIEIISDDIIQKIETKDYETIKSIFSKDAISNISNLDEAIGELISIADEEITGVESQMNGSETHWDNGQHRKTYRFSLDITTSNARYGIGFEYDYENPFNSETLGINHMVITDQNKNTIILVDNEELNKGY